MSSKYDFFSSTFSFWFWNDRRSYEIGSGSSFFGGSSKSRRVVSSVVTVTTDFASISFDSEGVSSSKFTSFCYDYFFFGLGDKIYSWTLFFWIDTGSSTFVGGSSISKRF